MNHGFINDKGEDKDAYEFGSGQLKGTFLEPQRDWRPYIPLGERQDLNGIEPYACASFNTLSALETLIRRQFGRAENFADRYLAYISGTGPKRGNSPHVVAETLRKLGDVEEGLWPFSGTTYDQYYQLPPASLSTLARRFFSDRYDLKHDYVPSDPMLMWDALQYSPLGASVYAWVRDTDDYYIKPKGVRDNHWVYIIHGVPGDYWLIADSYIDDEGVFIKKVPWDYDFEIVKRYSITEKLTQEQKGILAKLMEQLKYILANWGKPLPTIPFTIPSPPEPQPDTTPKPEPKSPSQILYNTAKASLGKDLTPSDRVPDEVACVSQVQAVYKKAFGHYIEPYTDSTTTLTRVLRSHRDFQEANPTRGCISVFPTGNGTIGHVGIWGDTHVMSNNSAGKDKGKFTANYTHAEWKAAAAKRGLICRYFLPV